MPIEPPPPRKDTYVIDPESGAEMARLINLHQLVTQHMGGLFPQGLDTSNISRVLDLACGPGGWVQDVAFEHQDMEVMGVDISEAMISYARAQARVQGLDNAIFQKMDIREPLAFPDNSFDFVNARLLFAVLSPGDWPGLVAECKRILRPGGILRLTEGDDAGISNSAALEDFTELWMKVTRKTGRAFFAHGRSPGTMLMIGRLLRNAGFQDVHQQAHMIDWSADTKAFYPQHENVCTVALLSKPFLVATGLITAEQFDELYNRTLLEMYAPDFSATYIFLSAWGTRPAE